MTEYILWHDKETRDLDKTDRPVVLEDYWQLTDITATHTFFTRHDLYPASLRRRAKFMMSPLVEKMHTESGLLAELQASTSNLTYGEVEKELIDTIGELIPLTASKFDGTRHTSNGDHIYLGGSGVSHFDRYIINRLMPDLDQLLHYSDAADVGITRRQFQFAGSLELNTTYPFVEPRHRAKDDVEQSIATYRIFQQFMAGFVQPTS